MALGCDVFMVDLDPNVEQALALIENICSRDAAATVMATSRSGDSALLIRSMRAGAREFLPDPLQANTINEAIAKSCGTPRQERATSRDREGADVRGGQGRLRGNHRVDQLRHRVDPGRRRQSGDRRHGLAVGRGGPGAGTDAAVLDPGRAQERGTPGHRFSDEYTGPPHVRSGGTGGSRGIHRLRPASKRGAQALRHPAAAIRVRGGGYRDHRVRRGGDRARSGGHRLSGDGSRAFQLCAMPAA